MAPNGAECAEWREIHDVMDDFEQASGKLVDDAYQAARPLAQVGQGDAEQDGKKQHLQDLALGKGLHHRGRHDVHEEFHGGHLLGLAGVGLDLLDFGLIGLHLGGIVVHASPGLIEIDDNQADGQGEQGHGPEIDHTFDADPADLAHVAHLGNARDHGTEDDRRDDHLDHADKGNAERLHLIGEGFGCRDEPEDDTRDNAENDPEIERLVNGLLADVHAEVPTRYLLRFITTGMPDPAALLQFQSLFRSFFSQFHGWNRPPSPPVAFASFSFLTKIKDKHQTITFIILRVCHNPSQR